MVNAVNTATEWQPRFAPHDANRNRPVDAFRLAPETRSIEDPGEGTDKDKGFEAFGGDGFTLLDAVDIINPLQHLPLVGPLYRELTGDTLDPFSRVAGSTLFFGPIGAAVSSVNVAMEEFTGRDVGAHMIALFKSEPTSTGETEVVGGSASGISSPVDSGPAAAGTDNPDPVTAWALNEFQYRQALAEKQGRVMPERLYSHLVNTSAQPTPEVAHAVRPPVLWSKPTDMEDPLQLSEVVAIQKPVVPATANAQKPFVMNAFQAEHRASPETLLRLKQSTMAYQTVTFANSDTPQLEESSEPDAPVAVEPDPPVGSRSSRPGTAGLATKTQNWLSTSMLEALDKYRKAETTDKAALNPFSAPASLH